MPAHLRHRSSQPRDILTVVLLSVFTFALLQSLINPVLPALQRDLRTTQSLVTWVMTAFLLSASVATPLLGRLGDRYGKHLVLVGSLIALAIGSLISAIAPNIAVMVVGRAIQGIGGGVLPLAFGIISDEMPRERIPGAIGVTAALTAVGGGAGIALAGPLTSLAGIRSLFWIPMVLTAVAAVMAYRVIPPSPFRSDTGVSWLASILLAGWLIALLVPLTQASSKGWASGMVVGPLIAAAVLAAVWILTETRSASPLVDMRMLRSTAVWATNLVSLLFGISLFASIAFLPAFVQTPPENGYGFGASVTQAGLLLLPITATMFLAGLASARLTASFGPRLILVAASALNVGSIAMLAFWHDRQWKVSVAMALLGVSFGSAFSTMANIIVATVRPDQTGVANGVTANVRTIGGSVGVALMGGIISAHTPAGGTPGEAGYTLGFAALGIAGVVALLAALLTPVRISTGFRSG
ncbi:MFS transporter [Micromonospora acroterricola]|uniref:MFS transporter n=1 Tax=Micromonospora acroterricola TaxID=2202421 RepID=A0A317CY32_9ACTN|nr:MFS transporter [Micromonospora acroterricola]PWR07329.1 MFS transporter [Micromonospora acroterricola]